MPACGLKVPFESSIRQRALALIAQGPYAFPMRWIFIIARFLPYWAAPSAVVLFELGRHFRRRKSPNQWSAFGASAFLILLTLLWFVFRGDLYSDHWVKILLLQGR